MRNKFSEVFLHTLHNNALKNVKITVINDKITLHNLFFGHCVDSSVIVFGPQYFSLGATLPQKNTSV